MNRFVLIGLISIFMIGSVGSSGMAAEENASVSVVSQEESFTQIVKEYEQKGEPHWYGRTTFSTMDISTSKVILNDIEGESHIVKLPVSKPLSTEVHAVSPDGMYIAYSDGIVDRDGNPVEERCPLSENAEPLFDQVDLLAWLDKDTLMIGNKEEGIFSYSLSEDSVKKVTPEYMPPKEVADALERKANANGEIKVEVTNPDGTTESVKIPKPGEYEHNISSAANAFSKKEGSLGLEPVCFGGKLFYVAARYTESYTKRYGLYAADQTGETFLGYLNWDDPKNISIISDENHVIWFAENTELQACSLPDLISVEPVQPDMGGNVHGIVPDGDSLWVCSSVDAELGGLELYELLWTKTVADKHKLRLPYGEEVSDLEIIRMEGNSLLYVLFLPSGEGEELRIMRLYTEEDSSTALYSIFAPLPDIIQYDLSPDGNTLLVQTQEKITSIPLYDFQDSRPVITEEEKKAKQIEEQQQEINLYQETLTWTRWMLPLVLILIVVLTILDLTGILHISGKWGLRVTVLILPFMPVLMLYFLFLPQIDLLLLVIFDFGVAMCWLFLMYIFIRSNIQPIRFKRHTSKEEKLLAKPQAALSLAASAVFGNVFYLLICIFAGILVLVGAGAALSMLFLPIVAIFFGMASFVIGSYIFSCYVLMVILGVNSICRLNSCLPQKYHPALFVILQFIQPIGLVVLIILMVKLRKFVREFQ